MDVPNGLRGRLLARLEVERGDYYRRWAGWGLRRLVAAAAVFLLIWAAWSWHTRAQPELDLDAFGNEVAMHYAPPGNRERVEQGFTAFNVHTVLPPQLNYALLTSYDLAPCQGKQVPMLFFQRGDAWARVYIVSSKDFNVQKLLQTPPSQSGVVKIQVWPNEHRTDLAYVVVYPGDSLAPFLVQGQAG
jgi:hypothetical protein